MSIVVSIFNSSNEKEWDNFVRNKSLNGTFLHTRSFFNHNPLNIADDHSLLVYKKNQLVAVFPAVLLTDKTGKKVWNSHLRSTFGGIVILREVGIKDAIEIVDAIVEHGRKIGVGQILICNPFRIVNNALTDEIDYALWKSGFDLNYREIEVTIDLSGKYETDIKRRYEKGARSNITKAHKEVVTGFSDQYEEFWPILEENLKQKHGVKPVHTIEEFRSLMNLLHSGEIKLVTSKVGEKIVCGIVLFDFNKSVLHCQYIGARMEYQNIRPVNAAIDFIIRWGNQNYYRYLNLGKPTSDSGLVFNEGLAHFKESFGGRSTLRESMVLNIDN